MGQVPSRSLCHAPRVSEDREQPEPERSGLPRGREPREPTYLGADAIVDGSHACQAAALLALLTRKGETAVVSGASGATGSVAAQLAKLTGARVVGIAGGDATSLLARVGKLPAEAKKTELRAHHERRIRVAAEAATRPSDARTTWWLSSPRHLSWHGRWHR